MYAVIRTGGKQERVAEGQRLRVELLGEPVGAEVSSSRCWWSTATPVLATPDQLAGASGDRPGGGRGAGPQDQRLTYKSKTNQRRRWGHRQRYATVEITSIAAGWHPEEARCPRPKVAARPATAGTRTPSASG